MTHRRIPLRTLLPIGASGVLAPGALAQTTPDQQGMSVFALFMQSFDLFTILILLGSLASVALIVRSVILIRPSVVLPEESVAAVKKLIAERRWAELQRYVGEDDSFLGRVLHESLPKLRANPLGIREATESAADAETMRRFREVELLGVIGNLGPLLGLVGTVWGMIIAFTAIGETGGQAAAAQLSEGIAKALFHTFLGLTLAIPSLLAFGIFRERLDRLCAQGAMVATDSVEAIASATLQPAQQGS